MSIPCPATWSMSVTCVWLILISFLARKMSLFDCGFRHIFRSENSETEQQSIVTPPHFPSVEDSGLGRLEYDKMVANHVPDLADLSPSKRRKIFRGKYTVYTAESPAKIGNMPWRMVMKVLDFTLRPFSQSKRKHHQKLQKGLQGTTEKQSSSHSISNYA